MVIGDFLSINTNIRLSIFLKLKYCENRIVATHYNLLLENELHGQLKIHSGFIILNRLNARSGGLSIAEDNDAIAKNVLSIAKGTSYTV